MGFSNWLSAVTRKIEATQYPASQGRSPRQQMLADPYYRLRSVTEVRLAAALGIYIDVNQACVDDWLRLPGISIHQARSLTALTQAGVLFHCLEDVASALSLPVQRLQPLAPVLRFCYYDAESSLTPQPLNANTALAESLTRIPAVDLFLARAIVQNRQMHGRYRHLADLQQRLSLSAALTKDLLHYLRFD